MIIIFIHNLRLCVLLVLYNYMQSYTRNILVNVYAFLKLMSYLI